MRGRAEAALRADLQPGEILIWHGVPQPLLYAWIQGRIAGALGIVLVIAALVWIPIWHGAANVPSLFLDDSETIQLELGVFAVDVPSPFLDGGQTLLLVLGGLAALSPLGHYVKALGLAYGITNRRAIIASTFPGRSIRAFESCSLGATRLIEHGGGRGSLILERKLVVDHDGVWSIVRHGFLAIAEVRHVKRILRGIVPHE